MPFDAGTAAIIFAVPFTINLPSFLLIVMLSPFTWPMLCPSCSISSLNTPTETWYCKILIRSSFFSGFNKPSTVPAGNFSNAALVGANTVNGPALLKASTSSAALTAANIAGFTVPTNAPFFMYDPTSLELVINADKNYFDNA